MKTCQSIIKFHLLIPHLLNFSYFWIAIILGYFFYKSKEWEDWISLLVLLSCQKFCNILVVHEAQFGSSWCSCQSHEGDKPLWILRCQAWQIFFKSYPQICLHGLVHGLRIDGFRPTWLFLIVELLTTRPKFLKQSNNCSDQIVPQLLTPKFFLAASMVLWAHLNS